MGLDIDFDLKTGSIDQDLPINNHLPETIPNQAPEKWTCEHLIDAVEQGNLELVNEMSAKMSCNCYHQITETITTNGNKDSWSITQTPLGVAVYRGDSQIVALLLDQGADINYAGPGGRTALMKAFI
ncbi:MAG: ankyrin repeat domain-containing protein, partial [Flavobacteriales bacterium]|nr:ankyrin repeat domain-containing protein [Flavobacteriales bacterium]